jgi:ADP-ribose pyrophosphatase YjhB (NUDIX family)
MWQFPSTDVGRGETSEHAATRALKDAVALRANLGERALVVRHSVTHHRITLDVFRADAPRGTPQAVGCRAFAWRRPSELGRLAMLAAHRRIARWCEGAIGGSVAPEGPSSKGLDSSTRAADRRRRVVVKRV